jgi:hypothetical protein
VADLVLVRPIQHLSQSAAEFNRKLAQLSERLSASDVVVSRLHADWASFDCWQIEVQRGEEAERYHHGIRGAGPMQAVGPQVFRCLWDGRDRYLMIHSSPTRALSAPNEWAKEDARRFDTADEALQYVEEYIHRRLIATDQA